MGFICCSSRRLGGAPHWDQVNQIKYYAQNNKFCFTVLLRNTLITKFTWVKTHFGGFYWVAACSSCRLKGTVPRDLRLLVFSLISFPQAPEYTIRAVSNFFKNLRNYSQLKVHHRCRWHLWLKKICKLKILIILFGHLWVAELTYI